MSIKVLLECLVVVTSRIHVSLREKARRTVRCSRHAKWGIGTSIAGEEGFLGVDKQVFVTTCGAASEENALREVSDYLLLFFLIHDFDGTVSIPPLL